MTQYENLQDIDKMAEIIAEASNMGEYTQPYCYFYLYDNVTCFTCNKDCKEGVKLWLKSEVEEPEYCNSNNKINNCKECPNLVIANEGNYSLFCCKLLKTEYSSPYEDVLEDIGWDNYEHEVSEYCPLNINEVRK